MKNPSHARKNMFRMAELAILTAIVLVFQLAGVAIRLPFLGTPVSLVLIPIVLGAVLLGPRAGAWLGFVFGAEVVIVCGVMATDPFTALLFEEHPLLTTLLCLGKGIGAGLVPGILYRLLRKKDPTTLAPLADKKNAWLSLLLASASAPIANTGIFILGTFTMTDTFLSGGMAELLQLPAPLENGMEMFYFLVIGIAGLNFLIEFAINIIFTPAIQRILEAVGRQVDTRVSRHFNTKK